METVAAVHGIGFVLHTGETFGLVGETGAGKTTTALTCMRLLPENTGRVIGGSIRFEGKNLLELSEFDMQKIRGERMAMIFQDPMTSLNPVETVDEQIAEMICLHSGVSHRESLRNAVEMLELVGIKKERAGDYPHQFSGGMKQRVVIAIALACNPELLIADEPTTALDVTIQAQVLGLMKELQRRFSTSLLLITHDLGIVAESCDKTAIMYAGRVVEYASTAELFGNPAHPYTRGLFGSIPSITGDKGDLKTIPGLAPDPSNLPPGCPFHPRCDIAAPGCSVEFPGLFEIREGHYSLCPLTSGK
ncbi:MAG: ABC transporter ATP-binding protein [Synergistaceae bacterium]|nr:ABC transporter ATP-binding protein [Synergistaceae bacterium]